MEHRRILLAPCLLASLLLLGCDEEGPVVPSGVSCNEVIDAGDSGSTLSAALAQASSGDCVVAETHTFQGSFVVKAGVSLLAAEGATPTIEGSADTHAVTVAGDPGSLLQGFTISGGGVGVVVEGTQGTLRNLNITAATDAAVAGFRDVALGGPDTLPADGITLDAVEIANNVAGLWASNVRIALQGGSISGSTSDSLAGGYGVVAVDGTQISANGTVVENNIYGVLIDGELGTTGHLTGLQVLGNTERGIWVQKLDGTVAVPALTIDGDTLVDQNHFTGLGAFQSKGIIIIGGKITGTQLKPMMTSIGTTEQIGDGIGMFEGTGEVKLDGVTLEQNQRSQGVIDQGAAGIIIIGGKVESTGGQHKIVVQNTTEMVQAPADYISDGVTLGISASEVVVGPVVQ